MGKRRKRTTEECITRTDDTLRWLSLRGARLNNLKGVDAHIPLGRFVCVTGVSGSGKSSLIIDTLREALCRDLNGAEGCTPGEYDSLEGLEHLDKIIDIDQKPIGRTPRSNPATYVKLFDEIRDLYTRMPDAKVRGYKPGRFSFNVPAGKTGGGRCEACEGNGANRMDMEFLADVWVTCPVCEGHRFSRETLQIHYRSKSIAQVLEMDVQEALEHFENIPKIREMLETLHRVGLDYLKLGQSSTTLSGGEAQRIKLARELVRRSTGRTLYLLDEPTTGLHFEDIRRLLEVLHGFVDGGNTVVVIEHNLDVIKTADWVIDLGPEGGEAGGRIVCEGTPEEVAACEASHTGRALREVLFGEAHAAIDRDETFGGSREEAFPEDREAARAEARGSLNSSLNGSLNGSLNHSLNHSLSNSLSGSLNTGVASPGEITEISVRGAAQHNLKNIDVRFPRDAITVCSGVSGSGKSSFALDTVYAEGQRRYVESLSAYARQFLGQVAKPRVEHVEGLSPAISIEQKTTSRSPRSTVGTVTEIYDYMRVLWARIGQPYCTKCDVPIGTQTADEIVDRVLALAEGTRALLLAPIERTGQEEYAELFAREKANGFARVRVDGVVHELASPPEVDRRSRHTVELVVDRVVIRKNARSRIADSIELALSIGAGVMLVSLVNESGEAAGPSRDLRFSQRRSCTQCGASYEELTPHHFSFNTRLGWCETCEGLGTQVGASVDMVVTHSRESIRGGAIDGWEEINENPLLNRMVGRVADHLGVGLDTPWYQLPEEAKRGFLYGTGGHWFELPAGAVRGSSAFRFQWKGFYPAIDEATKASWQYRHRLSHLTSEVPCHKCGGSRLRPDSAAVRVNGKTLVDVGRMPLDETLAFFAGLKMSAREKKVAGELLVEIRNRLKFLVDVGLDYVTLNRSAPTLSGGESQRIRLASQIGSGLTGVLYVLDEPTIGLHPRDNRRLIRALTHLRDLGNTLLMVEHDREVIETADHVLDFGPGAGSFGGEVVAQGSPAKLREFDESLTGRYLAGRESVPVPTDRRTGNGQFLEIRGARQHNLRDIAVRIPLGCFVAVTGVSGGGKSSLVGDILYAGLARRIHRATMDVGEHDEIRGAEHIDKVINVDQSPIGNAPSSNPATYTGVFDLIRELFAKLPEAKVRGYNVNRFSFNRPGGRCESCEGNGQRCIEMHFLPDVWITCEECNGTRYKSETLEVRYKGKSIADVLSMRIVDALEHFQNVPKIHRMLLTLVDVGLGYLELGQSAPTLSGGEAQRVKLAAELGRPSTGRTLYILDEPTTGLHFDDLRKLLRVLHRFCELGNTVVCIEHNLDVVKTADWVIDLGPEGGTGGGTIVAEGTPEQVAKVKGSHTGQILKEVMAESPRAKREALMAAPERAAIRGREALLVGDDGERAVQSLRETARAEARGSLDAEKGGSLDAETDGLDLPEEEFGDAKMPWEINGRKWHTRDRVAHRGEACRWEGEALEWIIDEIEAAGKGKFAPTDYRHRSRVEIKMPGSDTPWFFHARTGGAWLLDATFRVPSRAFSAAEVRRLVPLRPLDECDELPIYGNESRVNVRESGRLTDDIRILIHSKKEIATGDAREFIKRAVAAYQRLIRKLAEDVETRQPWKVNGRMWHLAQSAMSKNGTKMWQGSLIVQFLGLLKKIEPAAMEDWTQKVTVGLKHPAAEGVWGRLVTNMTFGMRVCLRCPRGAVTPVMIEKVGLNVEIRSMGAFDQVEFWVQKMEQCDASQLEALVRASLGQAVK